MFFLLIWKKTLSIRQGNELDVWANVIFLQMQKSVIMDYNDAFSEKQQTFSIMFHCNNKLMLLHQNTCRLGFRTWHQLWNILTTWNFLSCKCAPCNALCEIPSMYVLPCPFRGALLSKAAKVFFHNGDNIFTRFLSHGTSPSQVLEKLYCAATFWFGNALTNFEQQIVLFTLGLSRPHCLNDWISTTIRLLLFHLSWALAIIHTWMRVI